MTNKTTSAIDLVERLNKQVEVGMFGMPEGEVVSFRECRDTITRLQAALATIEASARGSGALARDRDADTLRAIELFASRSSVGGE